MPRRTKDDAEKTRQLILDAAERAFFDNGVAGTSLEQIAAVAKVTRGAVYWHFKDKIEVFEAMMQRVYLPQEDVIERLAASASKDPLNDLKKACMQGLHSIGKDPRRRRVISIMLLRCEYVKEMEPLMKRRRACKDRMLEQSMILLERAKENGLLSPRWSPQLAAMSLLALMGGLILSVLEGRKLYTFTKTAPACLETFFDTLKR